MGLPLFWEYHWKFMLLTHISCSFFLCDLRLSCSICMSMLVWLWLLDWLQIQWWACLLCSVPVLYPLVLMWHSTLQPVISRSTMLAWVSLLLRLLLHWLCKCHFVLSIYTASILSDVWAVRSAVIGMGLFYTLIYWYNQYRESQKKSNN